MKYILHLLIIFLLAISNTTFAQEEKQAVKKNGKVKEYYTSGQLQAEGKNKNYQKTGEWKFYTQDGYLEKIENYKVGLRHGKVTGYKNNAVSFTGEYNEGNASGEWKYYGNDGKLTQQNIYSANALKSLTYSATSGELIYETNYAIDGKKQYFEGRYAAWYYDGTPMSDGYYKSGQKDGNWKYWDHRKILIKEENYKSGIKHGQQLLFYPNGNKKLEQYFANDLLDSISTEWYENGQIKNSRYYKFGIPQGNNVTYYPDGTKAKEEVYSKTSDTVWNRKWRPDGTQDFEEIYVKSKREGLQTSWFNNGKKKYEIFYLNHKKHGKAIYYHENGKTEKEGFYKNDFEEGTWKMYNKNGMLSSESTFKNGQLQEVKGFEKGSVKRYEYIYENGRNTKIHEYTANGKLIRTTQPVTYGAIGDYDDILGRSVPVPNFDLSSVPPQIVEIPEKAVSENAPLVFADEMPEFPDLDAYFNKHVKYPATAPADSINAIVYLQVIIRKDGSVDNITLLNGFRKEFNDEAIRAVKAMPKWKPGKNNGKPVDVMMNIPVKFKKP